ncbi:MAG TPA: hydroxymethylglutaryl-CoA lyase [Desulfomonilaceae bacterium]|nr:hydroxymethylglutaryl-CoA lyase [Desulfomonilaceae bacterium]
MPDDDNRHILIQEVGPRDGLQNEPVVLSPEERAELIEALTDAGLKRIQIGSFVNPRKVPQMANTKEVWDLLAKKDDVRYSALVLNYRGLTDVITAGIPHVEVYVSVSETHSKKNSGATVEQAITEATTIIETAKSSGLTVTAGVMCAFGCYYEGQVAVDRLQNMVSRFEAVHPDEISLADTAGTADPEVMARMLGALEEITNPNRIILHLHDTRGHAWDNMLKALEMGIRRFDSSVGGLGGCPFVPGAVGNIATETTVERLHALGYQTGVDPDKVQKIWSSLRTKLVKDRAPSDKRHHEVLHFR